MFFKISLKNSELSAKWRQLLATVFLGPISFGVSLGWTSPVLPQLQNNNFTAPITVTVAEGSWIGSMIAVGVLAAAVPAGYLGDRFGPRKCVICLVIPTLIFTVMVAFARDAYLLYAARFVAGLAAGGFSALSPSYLAEISDISQRGIVASFFEFLIYGGVLLVSLCGAYIHYVTLTIVFCCFTLLIGISFSFFPESPTYLLRTNQREKALDALRFYRSETFNVHEAVDRMQSSLISQNKANLKMLLSSKSVIRGLIACFGLTAFQQLSGIDSITFYNVQIWQAADTGMNAYTSAIILSTVQFLSHVTIIFVSEKAPRRTLLSCSAAVCGLSLFFLGVYFHLKYYKYNFYGMNYMPLVCLSMYLVGFGCGLSPIPWMINGEVFPPSVKGIAGGMITSVHWLFLFFNTKAFPIAMENVGAQYPFYFYAFCMIICIVFIKFCVPETRGKSLEQIQKELSV